MGDQQPSLDNWEPLSLKKAVAVFTGASFRWWICGGHALDLHTGTSWRPHEDLDVGILRTEAGSVYNWLSPAWDLWVAARDTLAPWRGEALDRGRDENNVWARECPDTPWRFDLTVGDGNDIEWIYRRDESIRQPWDLTVQRTNDDIPYLTPEIQLLFKSKDPRPKDELDAERVIPLLDARQKGFLQAGLGRGHPWCELLEIRWANVLPHSHRNLRCRLM